MRSSSPGADAPRKNFPNLTGIRAFAATWVLLYHLGVPGGGLGVDIFFVLSGLVLSEVYSPGLPSTFEWVWYRKFLAKRLAKTYPIHFLTFIAMALVILLASAMHYRFVIASDNSAWSAVANLFLLQSFGVTKELGWNYPSWSVSAEWFAYSVLFAPIVFGLRRSRLPWVILLTTGSWFGYLGLCKWGLHSGIQLTTMGALRIAPEFIAGYLLYRLVESETYRPFAGEWFVASGLGGIAMVVIAAGRMDALLLPAVMGLLAGLYRGGPFIDPVFSHRLAVRVGEASYSIYMIQAFVIILANQVMRRLHVHPGRNYTAGALITVTVISLGLWVHRNVEEPLRRASLTALLSKKTTQEELVAS